MFAIVPPPGMCGGVPCFVGALFMIGVQVTLACPNPKTNPNPNPNPSPNPNPNPSPNLTPTLALALALALALTLIRRGAPRRVS